MGASFLLWFGLVVAAGVVAICFFWIFARDLVDYLFKHRPRLWWLADKTLIILGFTVLILAVSSPLYYEFPKPGLLFVLNKEGEYEPAKWGTWEWQDYRIAQFGEFDWTHLLTTKDYFQVSMVATPIAENPKSRKINYVVTAYIASTEEYLRNPENLGGWLKAALLFQLYEFNEVHSKELAELYNPLDVEQQNHFQEMVSDWLGKAFEDEEIYGVEFQVSIFRFLHH